MVFKCPKCGSECDRDEVDIGVGVIYGPYGCFECYWSEYNEYDFSDGKERVDDKGGVYDQFGGYHPPKSSIAKAVKMADDPSVPVPFRLAKEDSRAQRGTWAPGDYVCTCHKCKDAFIGDKRAVTCADCAYSPAHSK